MAKLGSYDHLNLGEVAPFDMEQTARLVESLNYGAHRFLSALVRIREQNRSGDDRLTAGIRRLLDEGGY
jgi:hypothetical protein